MTLGVLMSDKSHAGAFGKELSLRDSYYIQTRKE